LSDYLVLLSIYQTCKYRGVSFLKFLLSREDDVAVFCQRGRKKKGRPRLEVYPEGFPRKSWQRSREDGGADDGGRPGRVRWKPAILAFLRARPETGASRSEIADHCIGLIRGGTLVTSAPADDSPRLQRAVSIHLSVMKRAGEVLRQPGKIYFATARGLAWLERRSRPVADPRPAGEAGPNGKPEAGGRTTAGGDTHLPKGGSACPCSG
jgi:hypothetical protein